MKGKTTIYKLNILLTGLTVLTLVFTPHLKAMELEISGNGSSSDSEVIIQSDTTSNVTQENNAEINNSVETSANTGENEASGNSGDVKIDTGDIKTETKVTNVVNHSTVKEECCITNTTNTTISSNGTGSVNQAHITSQNNNDLSVDQSANITNSIDGNAITGKNRANGNTGGNVTITTGNINIGTNIENDVNRASAKLSTNGSGISAKIMENGADSENKIFSDFKDTKEVYINNSQVIENYIIWEAVSGENEVSGTTDGEVSIYTGDIDIQTFIKNFGNIGGIDIDCCDERNTDDKDDDKDDDKEDPNDGKDDTDTDTDKEADKGNGSTSSSGGGGGLSPSAPMEAGGPGILGLSDTSSGSLQTILFWLGLILISFGGKIVSEEINRSSNNAYKK